MRLADIGDHILTESVDAHVQPEAHDVLDLFTYGWIAPVQVRLLFGEEMEIVLVQILVVFPGAALQDAGPVVRRLAAAFGRCAVPPVIVIVIGIILPFKTLLEPEVLVGAVIHHQVHKHPHTHAVGTFQYFLKSFQTAEIRVDVFVIGDIVAIVGVRGGIQRAEPDRIGAEALDVIQFLQHAVQVADTVAVSVTETARPDLVNDHIPIPLCSCHRLVLLLARDAC